MNHFEAVEKMRELAEERNLREVEIEIDWQSVVGQSGHNVIGYFSEGVKILFDAAFQTFTIKGKFGSETVSV